MKNYLITFFLLIVGIECFAQICPYNEKGYSIAQTESFALANTTLSESWRTEALAIVNNGLCGSGENLILTDKNIHWMLGHVSSKRIRTIGAFENSKPLNNVVYFYDDSDFDGMVFIFRYGKCEVVLCKTICLNLLKVSTYEIVQQGTITQENPQLPVSKNSQVIKITEYNIDTINEKVYTYTYYDTVVYKTTVYNTEYINNQDYSIYNYGSVNLGFYFFGYYPRNSWHCSRWRSWYCETYHSYEDFHQRHPHCHIDHPREMTHHKRPHLNGRSLPPVGSGIDPPIVGGRGIDPPPIRSGSGIDPKPQKVTNGINTGQRMSAATTRQTVSQTQRQSMQRDYNRQPSARSGNTNRYYSQPLRSRDNSGNDSYTQSSRSNGNSGADRSSPPSNNVRASGQGGSRSANGGGRRR